MYAARNIYEARKTIFKGKIYQLENELVLKNRFYVKVFVTKLIRSICLLLKTVMKTLGFRLSRRNG